MLLHYHMSIKNSQYLSKKSLATNLSELSYPARSESRKTSESKSPESQKGPDYYNRKSSVYGKSRNVGGSLKYDIGRNHSVTNLINFPIKWSSVRIKGTGFDESRKSVVKVEPCNGIPNMNVDYHNLKSPTSSHNKNNIANVSLTLLVVLVILSLILNYLSILICRRFCFIQSYFELFWNFQSLNSCVGSLWHLHNWFGKRSIEYKALKIVLGYQNISDKRWNGYYCFDYTTYAIILRHK